MAGRGTRFNPEAAAELEASASWYEERRPGLGAEFADAVLRKVDEIAEAPHRWRAVRGARRALLSRFPYAIVYREVSEELIEIVAVAHVRRRAGYWADRR